MAKRTNLAAALHDAGASAATKAKAQEQPAQPAIAPSPRPPSRKGQRAVTTYTNPEAHKQLRLLSIETGDSLQELMTEALNELFRKHGKSLIA